MMGETAKMSVEEAKTFMSYIMKLAGIIFFLGEKTNE